LAVAVGCVLANGALWAQVNNVNNNNNNNAGGGAAAAGIEIDPAGVLRMKVVRDPGHKLILARLAEAKAKLDPKLMEASKLRKISLNRLEKAVEEALAKGGLTDEMKYLAGLTKIEYVFFYPETNDIVIAGPAEGFIPDISGRPSGITTGVPVLELEDLVVALRAFSPQGGKVKTIGCSIDPTQAGLANLQAFLKQVGTRLPGNTGNLINGMKQALGLQTVTINGISPKTHFAQVMVEADYRMKLIGIGLEPPPVRMATFIEKARPGALSRNALVRWYFVPNYEAVKVAEDELAMQMVGQGVKLIGADELVQGDGSRVERGEDADNSPSGLFTKSFTEKYPEIAKRSAVYAQLKNLIDMSIAAAFIQEKDYYGRAGWKMPLFMDEGRFPVETHNVPKQVETAVNAVVKGNSLLTPIGGGVQIRPTEALATDRLIRDEGGEVKKARESISLKDLPANRWWWD
jgi:hypothetical protein